MDYFTICTDKYCVRSALEVLVLAEMIWNGCTRVHIKTVKICSICTQFTLGGRILRIEMMRALNSSFAVSMLSKI